MPVTLELLVSRQLVGGVESLIVGGRIGEENKNEMENVKTPFSCFYL